MAPPTYAPSRAMQSKVVAVPKSTTIARVPWKRAARRVDQAVGPDLVRVLDPDRQRHVPGGRDYQRQVLASGTDAPRPGRQRGHHGGERDRR